MRDNDEAPTLSPRRYAIRRDIDIDIDVLLFASSRDFHADDATFRLMIYALVSAVYYRPDCRISLFPASIAPDVASSSAVLMRALMPMIASSRYCSADIRDAVDGFVSRHFASVRYIFAMAQPFTARFQPAAGYQPAQLAIRRGAEKP